MKKLLDSNMAHAAEDKYFNKIFVFSEVAVHLADKFYTINVNGKIISLYPVPQNARMFRLK
jgi:hypothetical protein